MLHVGVTLGSQLQLFAQLTLLVSTLVIHWFYSCVPELLTPAHGRAGSNKVLEVLTTCASPL